MKLRTLLFLTVTCSMLLNRGLQAAEPSFVPIAWYSNNDPLAGERASAVLQDHNIKSVSCGSASFTMSVPAENAQEARSLLAKAIQDEGLRINLLKEEQSDNDKILSNELSNILVETTALKAGSKRIELEKHFTPQEGGLSNSSQRTYVSKRCSFIKIDVRFRPLNAQQESPDDTILEISKPYLAYNVID